jgi:hypothetical protein
MEHSVPALAAPIPLPPALIALELEAARSFAELEKSAATKGLSFRLGDLSALVPRPPCVPSAGYHRHRAGLPGGRGQDRHQGVDDRPAAAAIRYAHRLVGIEPPTSAESVCAVMRGIRRTISTAPVRNAPATAELVMATPKRCPPTLAGKQRDLARGFARAFRRSELVALEVANLVEAPDGYRVQIRRSKTDQEGQGQEIAIPRGYRLRPVEAIQTWPAAAEISSGPGFRPVFKGQRAQPRALLEGSVAAIVETYAVRAGLDPDQFAGQSLRAGFLTGAAESGASVFKMMGVSRHKSVDTLRGYVRRADLFREHAEAAFL